MSAEPGHFSIEEVIQNAWRRFTERPAFSILIWFVGTLIMSVLEFPKMVDNYLQVSSVLGWSAFAANPLPEFLQANAQRMSILNLPIQIWITAGMALFFLRSAKGENAGFADLFGGDRFSFIWLVKIFAACLFALIAISLGLACLIVPGVVLLLIWSQIIFFLVDRDIGLIDAFTASYEAMWGNCWHFLILIILMTLGFVALTLLTCGLAAFVLGPLYQLILAEVFLAVSGQRQAQTAAATDAFDEMASERPAPQTDDATATVSLTASAAYSVKGFVLFDPGSLLNQECAGYICEEWLRRNPTVMTGRDTFVRVENGADQILDDPDYKSRYVQENFPASRHIWEKERFNGVNYWALIVFKD